jgi:2-aminoethylphosphonate-pyruvate transaminase
LIDKSSQFGLEKVDPKWIKKLLFKLEVQMERGNYLFCPGPVNVDDRVREACLHPQVGHRVPYFESVIATLQKNLLQVFKAGEDHVILLITGSGTAANESVINSCFTADDKVLVVAAGEFGYRLAELYNIHGVPTHVVGYEWGEIPSVRDVEEALKKHPSITTIATVYHETSTSVVHPISEIGKLAKTYGKKYFVDAISALGGEDINMERDHIDFCTCSSNKCLAGLAGVGIICARKYLIEASKDNPTRVAYLSLHRLYKAFTQHGQTTNTPSVTMFIALNVAIERLLEEGVENQIQRYKNCAHILREGLRELGLKTLVDDEAASNTVTSFLLPDEIEADDFIQAMENKKYTLYAGKGPLKERNLVQIANMGAIDESMCRLCLTIIRQMLTELKP